MRNPMSRKERLYARALAYSNANQERGADSLSWEDGYRAAMRDARRAVFHMPHVFDSRINGYFIRQIQALQRFLRPLR